MFQRFTATAVLTVLATLPVSAQTAGPLPAAMQPQMAQWLIVNQQSMIGLAGYGEQIAARPDVRQLAQTIRTDHEMLLGTLRDYAARTGRVEGTAEYRADVLDDQRDVAAETRDDRRDRREAINDARRNADGVRRPLENLADRLEDVGERIGEGARNIAEGTREAVDAAEDRVDRTVGGPIDANSPGCNCTVKSPIKLAGTRRSNSPVIRAGKPRKHFWAPCSAPTCRAERR